MRLERMHRAMRACAAHRGIHPLEPEEDEAGEAGTSAVPEALRRHRGFSAMGVDTRAVYLIWVFNQCIIQSI